jgi:hypothetical protein
MSCHTDERVRRDLVMLEEMARARTGKPLHKVRLSVARSIGIAPGTAETIRKRRSKGVKQWMAELVTAALVRELRAEAARVNHELELALARGAPIDGDEAAEAEAKIAEARGLLARGRALIDEALAARGETERGWR